MMDCKREFPAETPQRHYGSAKLCELEIPRLLRRVTAIEPWTEPLMESGSLSMLRLPNAAGALPNQGTNSDSTFSVMELPDTEQPGTDPQLSWTGTVVLKLSVR
jgi:hypothetical protein